jgi:hypothetical protein
MDGADRGSSDLGGCELTGDGTAGVGAIEGDAAGVEGAAEGTIATGLGLAGGGRGWEAQPERILPKTIAIGRQGKIRIRFMAISQA